ncbi:MAG: hypothetical protein QOI11_165 [Candidatus Eremiobacteraeota bacterium]|nr:hypothetical protein [Candidatus Eremiobacteraeota bacterium]
MSQAAGVEHVSLTPRGRFRHRLTSFGVSGLIGIAVFFLVPGWLLGATRFVAAYDAGVLTLTIFFWRTALHCDARLSRARAALDDPGRNLIFLVVMSAVAVGLIAAVGILGHGPRVQNPFEKWEAYILGLGAIALGWVLVHTVYTFRYAHLFYHDADRDGEPEGGLNFPGGQEPSDFDFAYFSFCIGTAFAVSDVEVTSTAVRREVLVHSIIAFAYNSMIVGMVINVLAGILSGGGGK